jgi:flagellar hook-associated protein 1 FlgK
MSLSTILNAGLSGLNTAQTQLRVVSDNVANANTPGYVRKIADQVSLAVDGKGVGVDIARIRLSTDKFLQQASLNAASDAASAGAKADLYDRVQSLFGDPSSETSFFAQVDEMFASFAATAESALSGPRRGEAVANAKALFDEAARVSSGIQAVRDDADSRIVSDVDKINGLLKQIEDLNMEISRCVTSGRDSSGSEAAQAQLVDQLSQLMDVKVGPRATGGVSVRTGDGMLLAGNGAATLSYSRGGSASSRTNYNEIWLTQPNGQPITLAEHLSSGELKGLIDLRDREAPQAADRLAELTSRIADQLNRAHNADSAVPAPGTLAGKNTGLDLTTAVTGFTGKTTVAIVDPGGVIQRRVEVDFTAGTMSVDGGAPSGFTPATFLANLNGALGGMGSASFTNGALTLNATGGNGVAVADDPTTPSSKGGRGFSWYFGLNDLVRSNQIFTYETGLTAADPHGFTPGQTVTFRFRTADGSPLRDLTVAMPAAGTMGDLLNALNSTSTGVGRYGAFSLDAAGELSFTPAGSPPVQMSVVTDTTSRGPGGPSFSDLFGVGAGARGDRADSFSIRPDILADPSKLALARLDLSAAAGMPAISPGDGRGGRGLADASEVATRFGPAGGAAAGTLTVSRYLSDLAGDIGGRAASAKSARSGAETLLEEANSRRASYEGVNLDEELVKLTTYQQAYNASARLIQAVKDMYDVLIGMAG